MESNKTHQTDWLFRLSHLKQTRHLKIQLKTSTGEIVNISTHHLVSKIDETPPNWFINLVKGEYPKIEYPIEEHNGSPLKLIIQANPMDEISEAWQESIAFFSSLVALVLLTFLSVQAVLDKTEKKNRALTQHSLEIQEERRLLSQELHDEFGQSLTAIKVMAVTAAHEKANTQQITTSIIEICDGRCQVSCRLK